MKRGFILILSITICIFSEAQSFVASRDGLVSSEDSTKHYVEIHFDSLSAGIVYYLSYYYFVGDFKNFDAEKKWKTDSPYFRLNVEAHEAISASGKFGARVPIDLHYSVELNITEGNIIYSIKNLEMNVRFRDDDTYPFLYRKSGTEWAFYDDEGMILTRQAHAKKQLEKYLNKELTAFIKAIKKASKTKSTTYSTELRS